MPLATFLARLKKPKYLLRQVDGDSMLPAYKPGRLVVGRRFEGTPQPGMVVIVRHGGLEKIKRIQQVQGERIYLAGDNQSHSTDSRTFGWLHQSVILAEVVWPSRPPHHSRS